MSFFRKKQAAVYGVMDVGADAIKAVVFEAEPEGERGGGSPDSAPGLPRVLKKFVWDLPVSYPSLRLVKKIKESVFIMTGEMASAPKRLVIAFGPEVGEYALQSWTSPMGNAPLTRKNIHETYQRLFDEHADLRRATIVSPMELLVNGYPLIRQEQGQGEEIPSASRAAEIKFRTLALFMTVENGAMFAGIKNTLPGIPIEFIPLVIAEKEALVRDLNARDVFLIDGGVGATALVSIREGRLMHLAFMALGTRRMDEIASRKYRCSLSEARQMMRHYARGESIRDDALAIASAAAADAAAEWKKSFLQALDAFYPTGPLSSTVFLSGSGALYPEIRAAVSGRDWLGGFSYAEAPSARVLEGAAFFGGNTLGANLQGPEDAGLAALMLYALRHKPLF